MTICGITNGTIRVRVCHTVYSGHLLFILVISKHSLCTSDVCMTHVAREGYCSLVPHPEQNNVVDLHSLTVQWVTADAARYPKHCLSRPVTLLQWQIALVSLRRSAQYKI